MRRTILGFFLGFIVAAALFVFIIPPAWFGFNQGKSESRYLAGPEGIIPAPEDYGLSKSDMEFYSLFWGRLIDRIPEKREELIPYLKNKLNREFEEAKTPMRNQFPGMSDRQLFIVFLAFRVNGSIPVYSLKRLPINMEELLLESMGNCQTSSLRLLYVLGLFGLSARAVSFHTPSLPGHMIVDARDPEEDYAFMLDPSNNVFAVVSSKDAGFFETIKGWSPHERSDYFSPEKEKIRAGPCFIRYLDPRPYIKNDYKNGKFPPTAAYINSKVRQSLVGRWTESLTKEFPLMEKSWTDEARPMPSGMFTLEELAAIHGFRNLIELAP